MRRKRGIGRGISVLGRAKKREEYRRKYCSKGIHHWRPVFGKEYHWSRRKVKCEYCQKEKQYNSLTKDWREMIRDTAKILKENFEKVRSLHPVKTFSKEGW